MNKKIFHRLILFFLATHVAQAAPPTSASSVALEAKLAEVMKAHPDVNALVQSSMSKFKATSLQELLAHVKACDGDSGGKVHQLNEQLTLCIGREIEEPVFKNQDDLKSYYIKKTKSIPADFDPMTKLWTFGDDIITVQSVKYVRQICLKPGIDPDTAVELLAHELVHFDHSPISNEPVDILKFKSARAYAQETIQEPGDEVEAYIQGIGLQVRRRGLASLRQPGLNTFFDQSGLFIESLRDRFGIFILDNLGYMKLRFEHEYQTALKNRLRIEVDRIELAQSILEIRQGLEKELQEFLKKRNRLFNFASSEYSAESERTQKLLEKVQASIRRLEAEIKLRQPRIDELKTRVRS